MNTKARLLFFATAAILILGATAWLGADGFQYRGYVCAAPASIPIPTSGTQSVSMARLNFRSGSNSDYSSFTEIRLALTESGSFVETDIESIKIYFEMNGDGLWRTSDQDITEDGTWTFGGGTATIPLKSDEHYFDWGGDDYLHVVLAFKTGSYYDSEVRCNITRVTYVDRDTQSGGGTYDPSAFTTSKPLDTWLTTINATEEAPASAYQGTEKVPVLRFVLDAVDISASVAPSVDSITLHKLPTATMVDTDILSGGILLYQDVDEDSIFEPGGDDGLAIAYTSITGGVATFSLDPNITFDATDKAFWVAVNVYTGAVIGHTVGLEISNPSTDIVFEDTTTDSYVYTQYVQKGYLIGASAVPASNTPFTITELLIPDTDPPDVSTTIPLGGATLVARDTNITVIFDENMKESTIVGSNVVFQVDGGATVGGTINYIDATNTMTFDPTPAKLDLSTKYRMTIKGASSGGTTADEAGNVMLSDSSFTFTIIGPTPPTVNSTSPSGGATGVARNTVITVTFNEDVTGVDGSTLVVKQGATTVTGTVTYDSPTWTATFTPDQLLGFSKTYDVTVDPAGGSSINDLDGTAMDAPNPFDFTTTTTLPLVVISTSPTNGAVGVSPSTIIHVAFSKDMNGSTVNESTFTVQDARGEYIDGTVVCVDGSMEATFDPIDPLPYSTFTVTLDWSIEDRVGLTLGEEVGDNYTFTFSTILDVAEPVAANNRIQPGVNDRTVIFIPQPPASAGGASARVTVQVFTVTGKRVDTLVNARTYSDLVADLPLLWYGKNGRDENLGPGLYFIRISAGKWVRTLKVMVVR
jgi:hypothetical protein